MGLLKSIDGVNGIDYYEYRDRCYYNKYKYRARFGIYGVRFTWYYKNVDEFLKKLNTEGFFSIRNKDKTELKNNLPSLTKFIEWREEVKKLNCCSVRIEGNMVAVFSNDLDFLHTIDSKIPDIKVDYTESQTATFVGIKHFVNKPKHNYRVYLKSRRVGSDTAKQLKDTMSRMKDIYPSSALKFWTENAIINQMSWRYRWSSASHFIDYDDESVLSYLALLHGDLLGKRYKLEKRPD